MISLLHHKNISKSLIFDTEVLLSCVFLHFILYILCVLQQCQMNSHQMRKKYIHFVYSATFVQHNNTKYKDLVLQYLVCQWL